MENIQFVDDSQYVPAMVTNDTVFIKDETMQPESENVTETTEEASERKARWAAFKKKTPGLIYLTYVCIFLT